MEISRGDGGGGRDDPGRMTPASGMTRILRGMLDGARGRMSAGRTSPRLCWRYRCRIWFRPVAQTGGMKHLQTTVISVLRKVFHKGKFRAWHRFTCQGLAHSRTFSLNEEQESSVYGSFEEAAKAGEKKAQRSRAGRSGVPKAMVPSARDGDGDGDGIVCER